MDEQRDQTTVAERAVTGDLQSDIEQVEPDQQALHEHLVSKGNELKLFLEGEENEFDAQEPGNPILRTKRMNSMPKSQPIRYLQSDIEPVEPDQPALHEHLVSKDNELKLFIEDEENEFDAQEPATAVNAIEVEEEDLSDGDDQITDSLELDELEELDYELEVNDSIQLLGEVNTWDEEELDME